MYMFSMVATSFIWINTAQNPDRGQWNTELAHVYHGIILHYRKIPSRVVVVNNYVMSEPVAGVFLMQYLYWLYDYFLFHSLLEFGPVSSSLLHLFSE